MSSAFIWAIVLAAIAGASAFLGACLGYLDEHRGSVLSSAWRHGITAFGGGALIGAVGMTLVPHGLESQPVWLATASFLGGGLVALAVDKWLQRSGTPASQLVALNLDFLPEAMVVGAVITEQYSMALFLAILMAAQNLPEGFNAYREVRRSHGGFLKRHILLLMATSILIGPLAAAIGFAAFSLDSLALGTLMTFFAGGIVYLVFEDIAPEAHQRGRWGPPMGAVAGFAVAVTGAGITG